MTSDIATIIGQVGFTSNDTSYTLADAVAAIAKAITERNELEEDDNVGHGLMMISNSIDAFTKAYIEANKK